MPRYAKLTVDSWENKKKNERKNKDWSCQALRNNSVEIFFHIHKHQIFALPTSLSMHNAEWVAPCCIATVVCLSFLSVSLTHNLLPDRQFYKKVNRTFSQSWGVFVREEKWYWLTGRNLRLPYYHLVQESIKILFSSHGCHFAKNRFPFNHLCINEVILKYLQTPFIFCKYFLLIVLKS